MKPDPKGSTRQQIDYATRTRVCECVDRGCPVHPGGECFGTPATVTLLRVDMDDAPVDFCGPCAEDAESSGLFADAD